MTLVPMVESIMHKNIDGETARIITQNIKAQHENNVARLRELRCYATADYVRVFDRVPELLNINDSNQPGYVDDPKTPLGVKLVERQGWRLPADRVESRHLQSVSQPVVEGLFLIGSSGSVGHTADSDLDYWVCYEPENMKTRQRELFQCKLQLISQWAQANGVEANFYLINLKSLAQRRFSQLNRTETLGAVAPLLLLEEFYRTFLFVAGRVPLWSVTPQGLDEAAYKEISCNLNAGNKLELVDLGFPRRPCSQEALGAAFWLAYKSETEIFKGFLKIVALLEYVETDYACLALAEDVKKIILTSDFSEYPVDPYCLLVSRIMACGAWRLSRKQLELLRVAAVLKVLGTKGKLSFPPLPGSTKQVVLRQWSRDWGWSTKQLEEILSYNDWPEGQKFKLEDEIYDTLAHIHLRIADHLLSRHPDQVDTRQEALAPLAARLLMRLKGLDSTVETLLSPQRSRFTVDELTLRWDEQQQLWCLHPGAITSFSPDNSIYQNRRALRVGAWLAHNGLYNPGSQITVMGPAQGPHLTNQFINGIVTIMGKTFPPQNLKAQNLDDFWTVRGHGQILVMLNAEEPGHQTILTEVDFIFRTGWGEMRHHYINLTDQKTKVEKYLKIAKGILKESAEALPENLLVHAPEGLLNQELINACRNIRGALASLRRCRQEIEGSKRPGKDSGGRRRLDS